MSHNWLDKIIAEQNAVASKVYGNPNMVSQAARATDYFSEDELEEACSVSGQGDSSCQ